ncbi:5,10-methenyltetrahydromethanopterin hydrogenase cofactor biosynthesis protein HmdC [Desulfurobacterium pacificum]|uniref:5,10-methenyltetrahydromethanopterin hydrogenase cofactor biosynthesis protein HmdC n=1 Tax=Desulfurobacterium pacificum TaxID=240166 RepID=A0ABY1NW02_9BACT|nr:5,10-methenyltetrahydromethanopterin hydrogenase cofactor biosynthesis protein HmdC [Desulfurobacterium pacificum]SMP19424.1 5,10-methenyltetrahydromethanopterin hydrogenase cofactor biosynthesis protein HmdC [Desulfurobacterium pacificum]
MKELIKGAIEGNFESKKSLMEEGRKNPENLLSTLKTLTDEELQRLGTEMKAFPFGCNVIETLVDVVSLKQSIDEIKGAFRLTDRLGFTVHVCSYVVADLAERENKTPLELLKELRQLTDMPMDADHFGASGPMRYPEYISKCPAYCYKEGKGFNGCPRGRIHRRLIEKEKLYENEKEGWAELVQSISVSLMSFQKETSHSASKEETLSVIKFAKERGKGVGAIICVGNGEDELLKGLIACMEYDIDEIVIEGGPYNTAENRPRAFGEAIVAARILSKGKIVASNGQYEDELRFGLRCGLNSVITGFPGNHHAYMSGYYPEEITPDKFGLPKVVEVMNQEIKKSPFPVPSDRKTIEIITASAKFLGFEYLYPSFELCGIPLGDAHWFLTLSSPLGKKVKTNFTLKSVKELITERKVKRLGILGARFLSWGIAHHLSDVVEEVHISDKDLKAEESTFKVLSESLPIKVKRHYGSDASCIESSDLTVLASFIPELKERFRQIEKVILL